MIPGDPYTVRLVCDPGCDVHWDTVTTTCAPMPDEHRVFVPWRFKEKERAELEALLADWYVRFERLPLNQMTARYNELREGIGHTQAKARVFLRHFED